jgi:hypothetical protein
MTFLSLRTLYSETILRTRSGKRAGRCHTWSIARLEHCAVSSGSFLGELHNPKHCLAQEALKALSSTNSQGEALFQDGC